MPDDAAELRAACDRLRRYAAAGTSEAARAAAYGMDKFGNWPAAVARDRARLAEAYLAMADERAADAAWVRSLPANVQERIPAWRDTTGGFLVFVRPPGNAELQLTDPTRGQVRHLLAAFGVTIHEPAAQPAAAGGE